MPDKQSLPKKPKAASKAKGKAFPIIAIGGSAGAFPALRKLFTHMPADSGMAFIIVMHLDPNHQGQLAEVIKGFTVMKVIEASDGLVVEPDHVYVIPPNKDMGIHNRKLLLLNLATPKGLRQPIDYFFQSLAEDQWNKAVGIVLSGMGSDGETGARMIKEKLGMVMVQDPQTAEYDSMPLASIGTNLIDYVLSPEEMPLKLIQYLNHPVMSDDPSEQARAEIRNSTSIQKILMLLRSHTGHDFSLYKKSTIVRRIDRRIAFHQLPDYVQYVNYLRENPQEIDVLFNELLIGVTKFFRDAQAFEALKKKLKNVVQDKKSGDPVRVWVAGCSTGEEAYSIAMVLMECLEEPAPKKLPKIQIFATDLDVEAIEHARHGVYHGNIVADVSEERLKRFFIKTDGTYSIKKELREMIVFAQHNLIKDAPFTRLDLMCCRNVMIYLTSELQKKIIPIFHYSLNARGIMFMGPAETIGGFTDLFVSIDPKWKIFERKDADRSLNRMVDFPFHITKQQLSTTSGTDGAEQLLNKHSTSEVFNKTLLENFTPPSVLVNEKGDILYTNGNTGSYLQLPHGEAVMNIDKMAREELRYAIGNIIHRARTQKSLITIPEIKLQDGGLIKLVTLHARLLEGRGFSGLVLVVFEDKGLLKKSTNRLRRENPDHNQIVEDLEKELVYTKQQLNSTIEQMETSLEELKSTNEELQSTNEELQSTNEESLTTKEEMQSLNEELMTMNLQYQSKTEELLRLNNDMKNLLDATEIGIIFLNNNLEILRFTPQIKKVFNVIPTDLGRPLSDIVSNLNYGQLEDDIREVIDKLVTKEVEIKNKLGEWYAFRIMPYRTLDNFISGAVLTFANVTSYKQLGYPLRALMQYSASVIKSLPQPALQLDKDMKVISYNEPFLKAFGATEKEIKNTTFINLAARYWQLNGLSNLLNIQQGLKQIVNSNGSQYEMAITPFIADEGDSPLMALVLFSIML
jgi:two-component system CheB/CheR fusion protein